MKLYRHALVLVLPFVFFGCFKTREDIAREKEEQEVRSNLQQNVVEYSQGLDKLQNEMGRLQGRLDEIEHTRKKDMNGLTAAQESQQKALTQSVEELKSKLVSMQEAQNALFEEVKKMREDSLASPPPAHTAPAAKKKGAKTGSSAPISGNFDAAIAAYKAKDYASATTGFRGFLDANPKSKKALEARYYLGDSLYKQKDYEKAAIEFGTVHEKSGASYFGRRSTLRLAQTFKAMGKNKDARAFALLLEQSSPNSEEAKIAKRLFQ